MPQEVLYELKAHDSNEAAYRHLTQAISAIADRLDRNVYSVDWATENHDHGSQYWVVDRGNHDGVDTLLVEGKSRGGIYELVPKPDEPAVVRYRRPDGDVGWTEEVRSLVLMAGAAGYRKDEGSATFVGFLRGLFGL